MEVNRNQDPKEVVYIEPLVVRKETAAKMLDCSYSMIVKMLNAGHFKTVQLGADVRVTVASLKQYVQDGLRSAETPDR